MSHPEICNGDHHNASFSSTTARSRGLVTSFAGFGRWARRRDARCATPARYRRRPPLAATSRDTVDGARPRPAGNTPQRLAASYPARDLLPLPERQPQPAPIGSRDRTPPPRSHNMRPHRRRSTTQLAADRPQRLTRLKPVPQLGLLPLQEPSHNLTPKTRQQLSSKVMQRPPEIAADMGGLSQLAEGVAMSGRLDPERCYEDRASH